MNIQSKQLFLDEHDEPIAFHEYLLRTRNYIRSRRPDLIDQSDRTKTELILNANSPFERLPLNTAAKNGRYPYGVLLLHGLLDSPFSFYDISLRLQTQGILSRSVLLPGHGTRPEDLIDATNEQWIETAFYGIQAIRPIVDKLYLIGYSTGAALAIYHALKNELPIEGIIMISPAIAIKAPISIIVRWHKFMNWISHGATPWLYQETESDYAKYRSITFNAVKQVADLTQKVGELGRGKILEPPIFIIVSREDDTISCFKAIQYFTNLHHPRSELLLYSKVHRTFKDSRVILRETSYPELNIKQFSHVSLPFTRDNFHYGQHGDFIYASHLDNTIYGAYNRIESHAGDFLYSIGLLKRKHHELTYNPDFEFMMQKINDFILHDQH